MAVERVRRTLARLEEDRNRGRKPRRKNQRAARGGNDEGDVEPMRKRSGHGQQGQEEED